MLNEFGFIKVGCASPKIKVADIDYNEKEIIKIIKENDKLGIQILSFSELTITGITCGDIFYQKQLLNKALESLQNIISATKSSDIISIIGLPLYINGLYNVAVVIQSGKILGIIPKNKETRHFLNGENINTEININNQKILIGSTLLFKTSDLIFSIVFDNDLSDIDNMSTNLIKMGANAIFSLGSSYDTIDSYNKRKQTIETLSSKLKCAYIYTSSNIGESTTDVVYQGQLLIVENGITLKEGIRYQNKSNFINTDIDVDLLNNIRVKEHFKISDSNKIDIHLKENNKLDRKYEQLPFIPKKEEQFEEILELQTYGLVKRLEHTNTLKTVIGISGGLDSTLSFLIILRAYEKLHIDYKNIIAVTMPGFGTSNQTLESAKALMELSQVTIKEISIKEACTNHLKDIGHDLNNKDVTYENSQARERTKILMDIANQEGALVIGTGDLSESALGYCTYNGDHMSMYSVNSSISKTLVKELVKYIADKNIFKDVLYNIIATPISPELLPTNDLGNISQKTEDKIGPYILHDFFIYHFFKNNFSYSKLLYIASKTFENTFTNQEVNKWLDIFIKRFFSQQFKRNCTPDGIKVDISLSPRDYLMPSDMSNKAWL